MKASASYLIKFIIVITIVSLTFFTTSACASPNITSTAGKTWIQWDWNSSLFNSSYNISVYVDGVFVTNTTLEYFILDDLNPDERHTIDVIGVDANNHTQRLRLTNTSTTLTSIPWGIIFVDLILFLYGIIDNKNRIYGNITAMFVSFILSFLIAFALLSGSFEFISPAFSYLFVAVGVVALIYTIMLIIEVIVEKTTQDEEVLLE